jgi:hypothetical protein
MKSPVDTEIRGDRRRPQAARHPGWNFCRSRPDRRGLVVPIRPKKIPVNIDRALFPC